MNKRIKELAEQAELIEIVDDAYQERGTWQPFVEKFAELIVLECINSVMDGTKEGDHYAMRIEQHFDNGPGGILHFGVE